MSTKFSMSRDINGYNGFGILPSTDIYGCSLTANVAQSITVPSNYQNWIAIFTYTPGSNIFVSFSDTAAVPNGTMGARTSVLNPSARQVKAGDVISIITPNATSPYVMVEFQVIPNYQN